MLPALAAHNLGENTIRDIQGDFLSNNTTHISIHTSEGSRIPTVEESQHPGESPRIPITHENDLSFVRSPAHGLDLVVRDGYRIHTATYRGRVVAVKVYQGPDSVQRLEADLEINNSLLHPTILRTVAVCKATQAPFVVLSSDSLSAIPLSLGGFKSLACRLADALNHSEKESVVLGAQLIRDVSSGLDYLASIQQTSAVSRLMFDLLVDESNNICITVGLGEGDATGTQGDGYLDVFHKLCVKGFLEANNECHLDKPQVLTTATESGYDPDLVFSQSEGERTMQMETSFESDCPPRREYVFIPDRTIGSLSLRRISTEYASFLRRTNNNVQRLQHKGRSSSRAVPHRCPGYRRDEVTLGTSVLRTAIIQHMTPSPREICPVCKQLVEDGMFYCSCGQGDDGMSPTIQCLRCRVWSHRTCQSNGDSIGHPLFTCASCRPILEHNSGSLRGHLPVDQGGRTVLPPISALPNTHFPVPSSYSNHYTQPRSSPRYDYTGAVYNQWPVGTNPASSSQSALYPYYENHENRALQQNYNSYQLGLSHQDNTVDSRRLPPLATSQAHGRDNRWQSHDGSSYPMFSSGLGASGVHIRSPTASYPTSYPASFSNGPNHGYSMPTSTPYGRSSGHVSASYSQPPVSPTSSEEPTIKKKRKRADANQLKILVETYNRTAFPSTEERLELAKVLDMTPRSVQIWFQNKRQSMRQTRQASTNSSTQQAFTMSSLLEAITSIESDSGYNMHKARVSPTFTFAHPRHARSQEADIVNPRKWSRAY